MAFGAGGYGQAAGVTVPAGSPLVTETIALAAPGMREREAGRRPRTGVMALVAGHACEQPGVVGRDGMTDRASGGKTGENSAGMTPGAGQAGMSIGQREPAVVETGGSPTVRCVAGAARGSILSAVGVVLPVAGVTVSGGAGEHVLSMASLTSHLGMFPRQREGR
jgi:hypothetical protein